MNDYIVQPTTETIMGRIFSAIVLFGGMFMFRFLFEGGGAADPGAPKATKTDQARDAMILHLAQMVGLAGLTKDELGLLTSGVTIYCYIVGTSLDMVLAERAFGKFLNGTIALFGAFAALYIYASLFGQFHRDHILPLFVICAISSAMAVVLAALAKLWVMDGAEDYMAGDYKPKTSRKGGGEIASERFNRIANGRR